MKHVILSLLLIFCSCTGPYGRFSRYHDNGKRKAQVVLLPVVNRSSMDFSWDVSQELSQGLKDALLRQANIFVDSASLSEMPLDLNIRQPDMQQLQSLKPAEFVILAEIIDHQRLPYKRGAIKPVYPADGRISYVLSVMARIHVVDIRSETPKSILHEIIHSNHLIPVQIATDAIESKKWGEEAYPGSPLGLAHSRLQRDLAVRAENYISVAKSY